MRRFLQRFLCIAVVLSATGAVLLESGAEAGTTITIQQPGHCNFGMSAVSSTSVTVSAGQCTWTGFIQIDAPTMAPPGCAAYLNCEANSTSDNITAVGVFGQYQFDATHWVDWSIQITTVASKPTNPGWSGNDLCGFNMGSIVIPAMTLTSSTPTLEMPAVTAAVLASPPIFSGGNGGTIQPGNGGCVAPTSSDHVYFTALVKSAGAQYSPMSTAGYTGDYVGVSFANQTCSYSTYFAGCPVGMEQGAWPQSFTNSGDSIVPAPCSLGSVTGDASEPSQVSGVNHAYTYDFGVADAIVLVDDSDATSTTRTVYGKAFKSDASFVIGPGLDNPQTIDFVAYGTDVVNPDAWCYSLAQGWVQWGTVGGALGTTQAPYVPPGGANGDGSSCYANAGWTLTDPVSWVTGALHDLVCLLQSLVDPTQASVTAIENDFGLGSSPVCAGGATATISQWLGCAGAALTVDPVADVGAMKTAADSGSCGSITGAGTNLVVGGVTLNGCTLAADSSSTYYSSGANSILGWFSTLLSLAVYALAALMIFFLIRRVLSGGAE